MKDNLIIDLNKKYPNANIIFISEPNNKTLIIKVGDFECRLEKLCTENSVFKIDRNTVDAEELRTIKNELSKTIPKKYLNDFGFFFDLVVPYTGKIVNYNFNSLNFNLDELYNQLDCYSKSNKDIELIFNILKNYFAF
ncbi:MAG: hypothetical protein IKO99_00205 [Bacteroidales bacterium]|nr:hypothetical protein [Bacteroidales bacterium]